jgi:SAM-dependent methyltransferase
MNISEMIEIISPKKIERARTLILKLKKFGIDHLDKNSTLGWNYALDHVWLSNKIDEYLKSLKLSNPIIFDVGCGTSQFHNFVEQNLNVEVIGIDRPTGYCHQEQLRNVDYLAEFLTFDDYEPGSVDIIYWLSAIEHNNKDTIEKLFRKSLQFLKKGGLLLITFPLSKKTYWFESSQQTNLSLNDAKELFETKMILGDYEETKQEFRSGMLHLKDKYLKRYGHYTESDPEFLVGGLAKIK